MSKAGDGGLDQAEDPLVRAHLEDELSRLDKADPFSILRVSLEADDGVIRRAFLNLTKRYHPNRFARRDTEIRRLANEVFIRFNKAHHALRNEQARQVVLSKLGLDKTGEHRKKAPTQPKGAPRAKPDSNSAAPTQQVTGRSGPTAKASPSPPTLEPVDPPTQPTLSGTNGSGPVRAGKPAAAGRSPVTPGRSLPSGKAAPRAPRNHAPTQPAPPAPQVEANGAELDAKREQDFEKAVESLKRGDFASALEELKRIASERPGERRYRLYLTYARGRRLQMDRRDDEAAAEFRRALALEPHFEPAKRALADLRLSEEGGDKDKDKGGFLKRFFGKP